MAHVFYWHPTNTVSKQLMEITGDKGFLYVNRNELEFKIQSLLSEAGHELWSNCHSIIGSLGGKIEERIELNPDHPLDRQTIKLCKNNDLPWCYYKINNGPRMKTVVGYCSSGAHSPFGMGAVEMAQRGISSATYVPRAR